MVLRESHPRSGAVRRPARLRVCLRTGAAVVAAASICTGAAAGLAAAPGELAAGQAAVSACDTAFGETYTTSAGAVTAVTITDIADSACEGGSLSVTLTDSSGASIASGGPVFVATDVDSSPNSVAVTLAPQPAAGLVAGISVLIGGP